MSDSAYNTWQIIEAQRQENEARYREQKAQDELIGIRVAQKANSDLANATANFHANMQQQNTALSEENKVLKDELEKLRACLALPIDQMQHAVPQLATYVHQHELATAKWIASQKTYRETAIQFALEQGKTIDDVDAAYKENLHCVFANVTRHGNDAVSHPVLQRHYQEIIENNKKK